LFVCLFCFGLPQEYAISDDFELFNETFYVVHYYLVDHLGDCQMFVGFMALNNDIKQSLKQINFMSFFTFNTHQDEQAAC
jgi:hypothetical protein